MRQQPRDYLSVPFDLSPHENSLAKEMKENNELTMSRFNYYKCCFWLLGLVVLLYLPSCMLGFWYYVINPQLGVHVKEIRRP